MSWLPAFTRTVLTHPGDSLAHPQTTLRGVRATSRVEEYAHDRTYLQGINMQVFQTLDDMESSGLVATAHMNHLELFRDDINRKLGHDPQSVLTAFISRRTGGKIIFFWWVSHTQDGGYKGLKKYVLGHDPDSDWVVIAPEGELRDGQSLGSLSQSEN